MVTPEIALAEYATLFGALPGVEPVPGEVPPGTSATSAVRHVLHHWESLTAEQQAIIDADLFGSIGVVEEESASVMAAAAVPVALERAQLQGQINELAIKLDGRLGRESKTPAYYDGVDRRASTNDLAYAMAAVKEGGRWRHATSADADWRCLITLTRSGTTLSPIDLESTLVHEIFHCIQFEVAGPDLGTLRDWLIEGSAEWVGEAFVGGTSTGTDRWREYLAEDVPLFHRSYDAMGFYSHMAYVGVDPWVNLVPMLETRDENAAFQLVASKAGLLDTWPTGRANLGATYGDQRDTAGPGLTDEIRADFERVRVRAGEPPLSLLADPGQQHLYTFTVPPDAGMVEVRSVGHGGWRWKIEGADTHPFGGSFLGRWVVGKPPACPLAVDVQPEGIPPGAEALIGLTGGLGQVEMVITVTEEAEDVCESPAPTGSSGPQPGGGPCVDCPEECVDCGRGASYGEPHLRTFDGLPYDFQGAGEFVLTTGAAEGALEVQARYRPLTQISVGEAIAIGYAGHRIGVYVGDQQEGSEPTVRLDGVSVQVVSDGLSLPDGHGQISAGRPVGLERARVTIRLADGSAVLVKIYSAHVDVEITLPSSARGTVAGLLGDFDGQSDNDLQTRDGLVGAISTDFDFLYRQLGPSWRVSTEDSLFDYEPTESPDTFWDPDFPPSQVDVNGLTAEQRAAAEGVCTDAGVIEQPYLDSCILDLALTGESEFVSSAQSMQATLLIGDLLGTWQNPGGKTVVEIAYGGEADLVGTIVETDQQCIGPGSIQWLIDAGAFPLSGEATRVRTGFLAPSDCAQRVFTQRAEFRFNQISTQVLIANGIDPRTPTLRVACESPGCGDWIKE